MSSNRGLQLEEGNAGNERRNIGFLDEFSISFSCKGNFSFICFIL